MNDARLLTSLISDPMSSSAFSLTPIFLGNSSSSFSLCTPPVFPPPPPPPPPSSLSSSSASSSCSSRNVSASVCSFSDAICVRLCLSEEQNKNDCHRLVSKMPGMESLDRNASLEDWFMQSPDLMKNVEESVSCLPKQKNLMENVASCLGPPAYTQTVMFPQNDRKLYGSNCSTRISDEADLENILQSLRLLDQQGFLIDQDVIYSLLQRCMKDLQIHWGRQVLLFMVSNGLDFISFLGNYLIRLFILKSSLEEAYSVFHRIHEPTVHSWHFIISGCVMLGEKSRAFAMFHEMQRAGVMPNTFIFTSLLKACSYTGDIGQVWAVHNQISISGIILDVFLGSTLVDTYAKCQQLGKARQVFDELYVRNAVCWNAMIGAYVQNGHSESALILFEEMHYEGVEPNRVTFLCVLKACSMCGAAKSGVNIHSQVVECGLESNIHVRSALIDMYTKFGDLGEASRNFQKLLCYDVVSWGTMMAGYIQQGNNIFALQMFDEMQYYGIRPDAATFSCAVKACGSLGALQRGVILHEQAMKSGEIDTMMISTLVEMYARCGDVEQAHKVLTDWPHSGIASWVAMITGYALHGRFDLARNTFESMKRQGIKPNGMAYTSILTACGHAGNVQEGINYFMCMRESGVVLSIEHFGCMVELLSRSGYLHEAQEFLESMPIPPDGKCWMSLLTGCRAFRNVDLGRHCFDQIIQLDSASAAGYQIMMQIYAHAEMWHSILEIKELRKYANAWRKPGKAWIEVDNNIHEFVVDDKRHPQCDKIYEVLNGLRQPMEKAGYVPETDLVFEAVATQEKEKALCGHCEKLAIAFGLFSLPIGSTIRVSKNLRMCNDCHNFSKIVSRIEKFEIVVSDEYCVHHFKNGFCMNGDCT